MEAEKEEITDNSGKIVLANIAISVLMFLYIFIKNNHESGGDMAIVLMNISFGVMQIIAVIAIGIIKKQLGNYSYSIMVIVICQILELVVFANWGYSLHLFLSKIGL